MVSAPRPPKRIALGGYEAIVGNGVFEQAGSIVRAVAPAHRFAIISDENVAPLYAERLSASVGGAQTQLFTIPAGESHKTREQWARLTDALLAAGFGRDTTLLAPGGRVLGPLPALVPAPSLRGIPFVQLPPPLPAPTHAALA